MEELKNKVKKIEDDVKKLLSLFDEDCKIRGLDIEVENITNPIQVGIEMYKTSLKIEDALNKHELDDQLMIISSITRKIERDINKIKVNVK